MNIWKVTALLAVLLVPLLAGSASFAQEAGTREKPNILFIQTDDLDIRTYQVAMPKTHALIEDKGMKFEQAYFSTSLCCPSRSSIFTGMYPHNTGVWRNGPPNGGFPAFYEGGLHNKTYGPVVDGAGYRTAYIGKVLNGYGERGTFAPVFRGFDYFAGRMQNGQTFNINGQITTFPETAPEKPDAKKFKAHKRKCHGNHKCRVRRRHAIHRHRVAYAKKIKAYNAARANGIYGIQDQIAEKLTTRQIEQASNSEQPWLIATNIHAPHTADEMYPDAYKDMYANAQLPKSGSYNEADVSDKPQWLQERPRLTLEQQQVLQQKYRDRLRSARFADDIVGRLIGKLKESGEYENTIIVFWTDNGFHLGQHRIPDGKSAPYLEDIRFPMLVSGPGIGHSTSDEYVNGVDLFPTFAQLAGADVPESADGRSMVPLLRGEEVAWRRFAYSELLGTSGEIPPWRALYTRDYTYHSWIETGEEELYRLESDPYEMENLMAGEAGSVGASAEADHPWASVESMSTCQGEECRDAETR